MAQLTLVLGIPSGDHTLEASASNVRRVLVPQGTRSLLITCDAPIFIEENAAQSKADGAAADATKRQKFVAGSYALRPRTAGRSAQGTPADRYIYIQGSEAAQVIWLTAAVEAS